MEPTKNGNGTQQHAATQQPSQALAVYRPPSLAYEPQTLDQARQLAKSFANSKMIPNILHEDQALLIMAMGNDLGLPATTALRSIDVINGRPAPRAQLKVALCTRRPDICKYFRCIETSDEKAVYETWRTGEEKPRQMPFTIDQAKRAGLVKPDSNWVKWPDRMLRARASSALADMVYPELVLGLTSSEELSDEILGGYVEAARNVAPGVVLDAEVVDQPATPTPEAVAINTSNLFKGWENDLKNALTLKDCDAIAEEMKARLPTGGTEIAAAAGMVKARKEEIRSKKPADSSDAIK